MNTLNRFEMRQILEHLDSALADSQQGTPAGKLESNVTWRLGLVKKMLLTAALGDVALQAEPLRVAA
jgi:hypothetical protein